MGGIDAANNNAYIIQPMNKREFVARCLMEVCGLDDGMAFSIMMKAHQFGISVIGNYHMEQAELYKVRLLEGKSVYKRRRTAREREEDFSLQENLTLLLFASFSLLCIEGLLVDMIPADDEE